MQNGCQEEARCRLCGPADPGAVQTQQVHSILEIACLFCGSPVTYKSGLQTQWKSIQKEP